MFVLCSSLFWNTVRSSEALRCFSQAQFEFSWMVFRMVEGGMRGDVERERGARYRRDGIRR